jgi:thermitase
MKLKTIVITLTLLVFTQLLIKLRMNFSREIAAIPKKSILKPQDHVINSKNFLTKKKEIIIAVIDTGIDTSHKALANNIWINPGEDLNNDGKCTEEDFNGIDNDGNGYIDDCNGWNFAQNNNNPMDTHGHGTHVAGIIAAITNVLPEANIKIMPLKYYDNSVTTNQVKSTVDAINYAIKMNVTFINYSAGGDSPSSDEKNAILRAQKKGIIFIAAAGNEKNNIKKVPYYPASYNLPNIVSVAAINNKGSLINKSNWGETVDIAAPGFNVLSTLPRNSYGNMSGTSMAASFVSGLAAIIMAKENCSPAEAIAKIKTNAINSRKLFSKISKNRLIDPVKVMNFNSRHQSQKKLIEKIFYTASIL